MSITLFPLILCFSSLFYAYALAADVVTLLSLLTRWTFVPRIIDSTWNASDSNPCSWVGIQCDRAHNVVSLNLTGQGILGQLGPEIGQLHHLKTLVLLSNGISGKVPSELSNCSLLEYLDLSNNSFDGQIPYSLKRLQNLRYMSLSSNLLIGEIPDSLSQIPHLEEVNLHNNLLSGTIPTNIGNLTELLRLDLHGNQLSGTIPSSVGNCSKLETLFLSDNRLNGELSLEIAKLMHLKTIFLFNNQLSGVIPQSLGINSSLEKLDLTMNMFTGNIPPNLCFGKQLRVLNMGFNQLQGSLPSDVGRCGTLSMLILSENNLTGSLPAFETNLNLKYMHISKNNISGPIPSSLENCTNLAVINMSMNQFTGFIPSVLGKLANLVVLDLGHNNLEGPLPHQLSNCTRMDHFDVGFNFLNGSFPSSLRSWTGITTLILRENCFTGGIPVFLSEFNMLRELQLGGNLFGGKIPPSLGKLQNLFYGLNLSGNGLTGVIPLELGHLQELQSLDLSLNNLTGSIGVLDELLSLTEINISCNFFYGRIPKTLIKFLNSSSSSFLGNPHLCVSCSPSDGWNCAKNNYLKPCDHKSTDHKGVSNFVIVVIELGSSLFVSAMLVALVCKYFRKQEINASSMLCKQEIDASSMQWSMPSVNEIGAEGIGFLYKKKIKFFTKKSSSALHDIVMEATDNLNDQYIIGRGAHAVVYKALIGERAFAVKKITFGGNNKKRLRIMRNEIGFIGKIRHPNLVTYVDYWVGKDYGILLCEYMPNSLHDILHEKTPPQHLSWNVRLNIAVGIANGLGYLHHDCVPLVVHRDIKPKNILLDASSEPLIADFGTAIFRNLAQHSHSHPESMRMLSAHIAGTIGYIAPETVYAIVQSRKSDVYSYGVVLLELVTRKKALIEDERQVITLVSWARSIWEETGKIEKIVDSDLVSAFPNSAVLAKQVTEVLLLALRCTSKDPHKRPTMKDIMGFYQQAMFTLSCDDDVVYDDAEVAIDVAPQPYNDSVIARGAGRIGFLYKEAIKFFTEKYSSSLHDVVMEATDNLNDRYIIGRGAHGFVYKAQIGELVFAVKKFAVGRNKKKHLDVMRKEIEILGKFKHPNLVTYADYWVGQDYGIVLFEYMKNGSLDDILHEKNPPPHLRWNVRLKIAVGIANGLKYLHHDCVPPAVHLNIKPKNILLDANMEPHVADFGTALFRKLAEHSHSHPESMRIPSASVTGTAGYVAPENTYAVVQSRKSDVYSYGVVLLELITRKRVFIQDERRVITLVSWARSIWEKTGKIEKIVDSDLVSAFPNSAVLAKQVTEVLLLALRCTGEDPRKRPTMEDVMGFYQQATFKLSCDDDMVYDDAEVAIDVAPEPYNASTVQQSISSVRGAGMIGFLYKEGIKFFTEKSSSSLHDIVMKATDNLNDRYIIGRGAHSVFYKARIGILVFAVKKFAVGRNNREHLDVMRNEIEILGMIKHRNLVKCADCWVGQDYGIVLYEYMKNGSLRDILHEKNPPPPLCWNVRLKIAVGIANGLKYLHHDCVPPVVHRDIKPGNILLDANMEPHVANFGTALFESHSPSDSMQTCPAYIVGTIGYFAPEIVSALVQGRKCVPSRKWDVYSYGVVLLELVTRKRAVTKEKGNIVSWARSIWGDTENIVDSDLVSAFPNSAVLAKQVTEVLLLALRCTREDPRERPTMEDVMRFYQQATFKLSCDDDVVYDDAESCY